MKYWITFILISCALYSCFENNNIKICKDSRFVNNSKRKTNFLAFIEKFDTITIPTRISFDKLKTFPQFKTIEKENVSKYFNPKNSLKSFGK